ncbi:hypothetical protein KJ969_01395 [Patescibacteria group bacterium]|nr:hypothetical protein [Patescibacteria group bacterium]MBU1922558.1 hypothetical protein [Patescibacteria group bacterium]
MKKTRREEKLIEPYWDPYQKYILNYFDKQDENQGKSNAPIILLIMFVGLSVIGLILSQSQSLRDYYDNHIAGSMISSEPTIQAAEKPYKLADRGEAHVFVATPNSPNKIKQYLTEIEGQLYKRGHDIKGIYPLDIHDEYQGPVIFLVEPFRVEKEDSHQPWPLF